APVKPFPELGIGPNALGSDKHESPHRPSGNIHQAGVSLAQRLVVAFTADARDEVVLVDAAAHGALHHEAKPAEHPFFDGVMPGKPFANPLRQLFVERHDDHSLQRSVAPSCRETRIAEAQRRTCSEKISLESGVMTRAHAPYARLVPL